MEKEAQPNLRLTATELGALWSGYMDDSMAICVLKHFLSKAEDEDVISILNFALELSQKHVDEIAEIFKKENQPIPHGFTDNDVNLDAPRLFSDTFVLVYLHNMGRLGLTQYGAALPFAPRDDVLHYFKKCIASSAELTEKLAKVMLEKGIYSRSPYVPTPQSVTFIERQSYMNGWLGKQHPLTAMEITGLFLCQQTNSFLKVLLSGYAQVAQDDGVRKYLQEGKEIASKHTEVFSGVLKDDELPSPRTWDSEVTESITPPFSDKLMMFHSRALSVGGIASYGASMSTLSRHDLMPTFARLIAELGKYGNKGAEIMIKHKWQEEPPRAADRNRIIKDRKN
ncbi:DUF3231 family protein [Virgibacillus sp. 179-BFC.A HS]|uniref:DUF3231 family protein n=1 Tax=Tigheibacillus jepli TaxID=3035914 RepID=A0ABU5CGM3_9BACI|nr:DUF3231 family protein [Virgibacillus sp. 179-BFC.A HS]MDY0405012.1 DUF3231 family protein [Virgibacillus sp. 179-BFC.A HS]